MAFDLLTKKRTGRDWSCGDDAPTPDSMTPSSTGRKIAPFLTAGAIGFMGWVIYNQPPAHRLQEARFRQWKRSTH